MPSTTHRLTAPDRRRQLIEAAMDLFSRKGFAGTTTKEIALAAGVSEAIIFRHFATKRDLYTAIIEHNIHSTGAKQVLAGIEACMKRRDDEGLFRLIAREMIEEHRKDPRFEKLMLHASLEGHELADHLSPRIRPADFFDAARLSGSPPALRRVAAHRLRQP